MESVLNKLVESLNNGNILLAMIIVAVAIIFNYQRIFTFIEDRKKVRIIKLMDALKNEHLSGLTKEHLQAELVTEQFKISTGIGVEQGFREALIAAHKNTNGDLSFIHFKRALPHLVYKNQALSVKISLFETTVYWFNLVFGIFMIFGGLFLMVIPGQVKGFSILQAVSTFSMGVFFVFIAMFMLFQTFPVISARRVSTELEKYKSGAAK